MTAPLLTLESGDRLTREEFEDRYGRSPHIKKAELINGVVFVASPIRVRNHAQPHSNILGWLFHYSIEFSAFMVCDNATVRLDHQNEVQPDVLLRLEASAGGQSRISADDYIEGAPELVIEIATSSAAYDLHDKKDLYCRFGVKEYLVWVVSEQVFYWYHREQGSYVQQQPDREGVLRSQEFTGLWLNLPALLQGNMKSVMITLQQGLASPECQRFAEALKRQSQ
ncbi:Uma2 family endonuclease [Thermosynechococcus sp. QKsg1]|uniref:Uma2 family endonuclease n=1 Tax=Thermosynechococcus sp. QKsg1 TaxID=3074130 RepID=UPI002877BE98|nr:Uma2 family endonuclease [Thermosynechococcus sp. QKsg1]WNC85709.1 Uma2 family endonuclease [Thermosynechococcus sp. QKsg1]